MDRVAEAVAPLALPGSARALKTAVSEATMNAIEYGSRAITIPSRST
jgi:anti-sigma regulatory factor (Ser/Thr protein kinase)